MPKSDITNLKISMEKMKTDLEYIKAALSENGKAHEVIIKKMDLWIEGCENRFSAKWVETTLVWIGRIVIGAVILALLGLIINKNT